MVADNNIKPSPFNYENPGDFLNALYRFQKNKEPGISQRFLASAMGYKSSSAFNDIIKGRILPNNKVLNKLKEIFDISDNEIKYLAFLIVVKSVKDPYYFKIISDFFQIVKQKHDNTS